MKQLIFRLNQQQYRNAKYKKKTPPFTDSQPIKTKGVVQGSSRSIGSIPVARMLPEAQENAYLAGVAIKKSVVSSPTPSFGTSQRAPTPSAHEFSCDPSDIYEVPPSPGPFHSAVSCNLI